MTAQDLSSVSTPARQGHVSSSADIGKSKRARTKHACDECRRSQKKCDGDKPLCRRCYLNGTKCTYTPHKSRNQCPCTGQGDETHPDVSIADVFIFPDSSLSSFHTWSATSSPDQSPSTSGSGLETPSPTNMSQDIRFEPTRNTVIDHATTLYEAELGHSAPESQRERHLYSHRSYSLPSFSNAIPASMPLSSRAMEFTSHPVSASLPHNSVQDVRSSQEAGVLSLDRVGTIKTEMQGSGLPPLDEFRKTCLMPRDILPDPVYGTSPQYNQHIPDAHLSQCHASFLNRRQPVLHPSNQQTYARSQYDLGQGARPAMDAALSQFSLNYTSQTQHRATYAPWGAQALANSVPSAPLNVQAAPDARASSQQYQYTHIDEPSSGYYLQSNQNLDLSLNPAEPSGIHPQTFGYSPSSEGRQPATGMMLHNLPTPQYFFRTQTQWEDGNGPISPSPSGSGSYPNSANPSPTSYSTTDFYDWSR